MQQRALGTDSVAQRADRQAVGRQEAGVSLHSAPLALHACTADSCSTAARPDCSCDGSSGSSSRGKRQPRLPPSSLLIWKRGPAVVGARHVNHHLEQHNQAIQVDGPAEELQSVTSGTGQSV